MKNPDSGRMKSAPSRELISASEKTGVGVTNTFRVGVRVGSGASTAGLQLATRTAATAIPRNTRHGRFQARETLRAAVN